MVYKCTVNFKVLERMFLKGEQIRLLVKEGLPTDCTLVAISKNETVKGKFSAFVYDLFFSTDGDTPAITTRVVYEDLNKPIDKTPPQPPEKKPEEGK